MSKNIRGHAIKAKPVDKVGKFGNSACPDVGLDTVVKLFYEQKGLILSIAKGYYSLVRRNNYKPYRRSTNPSR